MKKIFALLIFVLFLSGIAFSENVGNITLDQNVTTPPTTGLFGYTVQYCSSNADCKGYSCFIDYSSSNHPSYTGYCDSPTNTGCYHNYPDNAVYSNGYSECATNSSYRLCSLGSWSLNSCSASQTCLSGICNSSSSTSSSNNDNNIASSNQTTSSTYHSIIITAQVDDFEILQDNSTIKSVTVKNNGNDTLFNISLAVDGIENSWYSITPDKYNSLAKNSYATFTIYFTIPANATVKSYLVTIEADTHNASAKYVSIFTLKILPTITTIQNVIIPRYNELTSIISNLEKNITDVQSSGKDVSSLRTILDDIKNKMSLANQSINNNDYYTANVLMGDAANLIDNFNENMNNIIELKTTDFTFIIIIIVIVAIVGGVLAFMFWPSKKESNLHIVQDKKPLEVKKSALSFLNRKKRDKFGFKFKK